MAHSPVFSQTQFPVRLSNDAATEASSAHESFTWGPQSVLLMSGFIVLYWACTFDSAGMADNTAMFLGGAGHLAVLTMLFVGWRYKQRVTLLPFQGQIGCYQGDIFKYSFAPPQMARIRLSRNNLAVRVFLGLVPMLLASAVMYDVLVRDPAKYPPNFVPISVYMVLFAIFAIGAVVRSSFMLVWFRIPDETGKNTKRVRFYPKEARKFASMLPPEVE